jgi:hypothetical protein
VALKSCTVIIQDLNQTEHALDVTAETLYEAVAQVLAALRVNDWGRGDRCGLTNATVTVRHPEASQGPIPKLTTPRSQRFSTTKLKMDYCSTERNGFRPEDCVYWFST